MDKVPKKKTVS